MKRIKIHNTSHKKRIRNLKRAAKRDKRISEYFIKINVNDVKTKIRKSKKNMLLEFISSKVKSKTKIIEKNIENEITIEMPANFSLIESPNEVFSIIHDLISIYENRVNSLDYTIHFDYSKTTNLELGALSLKNVICLSLEKLGFTLSGTVEPWEDDDLKGLYFFSGLYNALKLDPKQFLEYETPPLRLSLIGGGKNQPEIPCGKMKLAGISETKVTDWFNNCLKNNGFILNAKGYNEFLLMLGEIFSNCDEHSGDEINQYYCSAHYHHTKNGLGRVRISIFNFGQTIAEGLDNNTNLPKSTIKKIEILINKHSKKFKIFKDWDKESLLTLYSLQNEISRLYDSKKTRGTGTVKFIQSFTQLGKTCLKEFAPKLTIISGHSQIIIDNSDICNITSDLNIPLNKEQNLDYPPSDKYVKKNNCFFPGTMISLDIFLDRKTIIEEKEKMNG